MAEPSTRDVARAVRVYPVTGGEVLVTTRAIGQNPVRNPP